MRQLPRRDAHLAWAAASIDPIEVIADDSLDATAAFADEIDNFRAAFEWAIVTGDPDGATRCLAPLGSWEVSRGDPRAGVEIAIRALEMPGASLRLQCLARASLAFAYAEAGDAENAACEVEELVPVLDHLDDDVRAVCLLAAGGALQLGNGLEHSIPPLEGALASARQAGRADAERSACALLATSFLVSGEWDAGDAYATQVPDSPPSRSIIVVHSAREYAAWTRGRFDEAQQILDCIPGGLNPRLDAQLSLTRMQLDLARGSDSGAAARLTELIDQARRRGFTSAIALLGWGPGVWRMLHCEPEAGAEDVVAWCTETKSPWGTFVLWALLTLGRIEEARAQLELERDVFWGAEANAIRATVDTVLTRVEGDLAVAEQRGYDALVAQHRDGFRPQLVHTLEALAGLAAAQGSYVECARLAGGAQALRDEMGYVLRWPYETELRDADFAAAARGHWRRSVRCRVRRRAHARRGGCRCLRAAGARRAEAPDRRMGEPHPHRAERGLPGRVRAHQQGGGPRAAHGRRDGEDSPLPRLRQARDPQPGCPGHGIRRPILRSRVQSGGVTSRRGDTT